MRGQQAAEPKLAFSSNETHRGPSGSELIVGQAQAEEVRAVNLASDTDPVDLSGHFLETQPMENQVIDAAQHITPLAWPSCSWKRRAQAQVNPSFPVI